MGREERRDERATVDSERGRRRMRGPLGGGEWEVRMKDEREVGRIIAE